MSLLPFQVRHELPGWELMWVRLHLHPGHEEALAGLRLEVAEVARANFEGEGLADHPTVQAVRKLFRAAGCDPTRYRPSSEALLRRLLKGEELPVPCCASAEGSFTPPVTLRAGRQGETVQSLRGPFNLEGKPLMEDAQGPFSTPITDSERVRVGEGTERAWIVAYLPHGTVDPADARARLDELLARALVAEVEAAGFSSA
jgi:DNA/RNA-binding domain of Phe-tRNA-synthetase-like protein